MVDCYNLDAISLKKYIINGESKINELCLISR